MSEKLTFRVLIDGLLFDGAALRYFDREALLRMLPMKGAMTFASGSTSPGTLPRTAGCLQQGPWLRWLWACVLYPSSTWCACVRVVSARLVALCC